MDEKEENFARRQIDIQLWLGLCLGSIALAGAFLIASAQLVSTSPGLASLFSYLSYAFAGGAIICIFFFVAHYRNKLGWSKKKEKIPNPIAPNENEITVNKGAWTFFMGAIVGLVGSFLGTAIFEFAKLILPSGLGYSILYWGIIFLVSSVAFFSFIKITLDRIGIHQRRLFYVIPIAVCLVLGLMMIILGVLSI